MVAAAMAATVAASGFTLATNAPVGAQGETCNGLPATIVGTSGDDRLVGTPQRDVIVGLEGRDIIFGREGNGVICAGPGNDVVKGGAGKDYIEGNQGNDRLVGGIGADTLSGGSAKDRLFGGGGGDTLIGGSKLDFLNGQNGNDTCDLDRVDRFAACERGDVIGMTGRGTMQFDVDVPDDFAVQRAAVPNTALQNGSSVVEQYAVELFWTTSNEVGVSVEVRDASGDSIDFFFGQGPSGLVRLLVLGKPATIIVSGADYFEYVVLNDDVIGVLSRNVEGQNAWLWYLDDPIEGSTDFILDINAAANDEVVVETLASRDVESEFFFVETDGAFGRVTGTTNRGVSFVVVEALDYQLLLTPAA